MRGEGDGILRGAETGANHVGILSGYGAYMPYDLD